MIKDVINIKTAMFNDIKNACLCKTKDEEVYLLIRKDNLEIIRMTWNVTYEEAEDYFSDWLADLTNNFTVNDCFIVKVCQKSLRRR